MTGNRDPLAMGLFFKISMQKVDGDAVPVISRRGEATNLVEVSTTINSLGAETGKHDYAVIRPMVGTSEGDARHFVSQLRLFSALCTGCCSVAEKALTPIAPFDVVLLLSTNTALTYRIRASALVLLYELHIETIDNRPVLTKEAFAIPWHEEVCG